MIRFAIIGCGHIGKRHCEKIARNPEAEVVALVDPKNREETLGKELEHLPYFASVEELLLSAIPFDIASVCVPNGSHFDVACQLIENGKNLLIEKPIVLYPEQGEILQKRAQEQSVKVYGVLQNRYTPTSQWLLEMIRSNRLGKLFYIDLECMWNRDHRYYTPDSWHGDRDLDGGTLFTQYSHFVDLLLWLFGKPQVEGASFANFNHQELIDFEDSGWVQLAYPDGAQGTIRYSTSVFGSNQGIRLAIIAEKGTIVLDGPFMNQIAHCQVENYTLPEIGKSAPGNFYGAYSGSAQNHHIVIEEVVKDLQGKPNQSVTMQDALQVVSLIREIYATNPWLLNDLPK